MLSNLSPIQYTKDEQIHVNTNLLPLGKKGWDDNKKTTKDLKVKIMKETLRSQRCRCAYCELRIRRGEEQIEHFVPKSIVEEFTYEPMNLFSSCGPCNSRLVKGNHGIIDETKIDRHNYCNNIFLIVHPYLVDPEKHIFYQDKERLLFDKEKCTDLGKNTIKFFGWDTTSAYENRCDVANQRIYSDEKIEELIQEIINYR